MNWTEEKEPNEAIRYNYVGLGTPLGEFIIDWKGWKGTPSYDVNLKGEWIGTEYDLDSAKSLAENYLFETANQLNGFIKQNT